VIAGPTLDGRIELIDHSFLRSLEVSGEHRCHIGDVSFLSIFQSDDIAVARHRLRSVEP
jgi:hypothetical protein